jgi:hypothetical protein
MKVLQDLGHTTVGVPLENTSRDWSPRSMARRVSARLYRAGLKRIYLADERGTNRRIMELASSGERFDVAWLDKALPVYADTLRALREGQPWIRIAGFSGDDMLQTYNQSRQLIEHLPLYDVFFTTKTYNVPELISMGCRRAEFVDNSYDPATHRPIELTAAERERFACDVGFVGQFEEARYRSMRALIDAGFPIRVSGPDWEDLKDKVPGLDVRERFLSGLEYARAVNAARINLGFLRKSNRDLQTTRSVEIPACAAFMLAERTAEHSRLFDEGKEAEFFDSDGELIEKVRYYLSHEEERREIGRRGLERCRRSGYSNHDHLRAMLAIARPAGEAALGNAG